MIVFWTGQCREKRLCSFCSQASPKQTWGPWYWWQQVSMNWTWIHIFICSSCSNMDNWSFVVERVSCHGLKYCILILVIVFFSVMICIRQFSVTEQVDYLLRQATSIDNLSNMYEGWTPWIWERQQRLQSSEGTKSEADLLIRFEGSWKSIIGSAGVYFCVPLSAPKVKDWN